MTRNNIKVAITGGIGSGKSTVSKIIAERGYNVVSCDDIYSELLTDKDFLNSLSAHFKDAVSNGVLDRHKLSEIVFKEEENLKRLNALTHPVIMQNALLKMQGEGINFCEVPLLFEGGFENLFDKVIVVLRDKSSRINAVTARDNLDILTVEKRIKSQINYDNRNFEDYYVIHNDGSTDKLRIDTIQIIKKLEE